jgi:ATP-dependent Zn protease
MEAAELERRRAYHEAGHTLAAVTLDISFVRVTIADDRPHLHRAGYHAPRQLGIQRLAMLCLAGPIAEEMFCGGVGDGCGDRIDQQMVREYLSEHYSDAELDRQLAHTRRLAHRLVRHTRREIEIVAHALLRHVSLDSDQIAELLSGSSAT